MFPILSGLLVAIAIICLPLGRRRSAVLAGPDFAAMHSRPGYHGWWLALMTAGPAFAVLALWSLVAPRLVRASLFAEFSAETAGFSRAQRDGFWRDVQAIAGGDVAALRDGLREQAALAFARLDEISVAAMIAVMVVVGAVGFVIAWRAISPGFRARDRVEGAVRLFLMASAGLAVLTTIGIVLSLIVESLRFFSMINPIDFLFGLTWTPQQMAFRADQVGGTAAFGFVPLLAGTLLITTIAIAVAAPIGILAAIYLSDYASAPVRAVGKPMLEILAGIPTVVYGFFAALTVAPLVRNGGQGLGFDVSSESALAAGVVMGIMIVPFVSSLSDDVINAVPQSLRDGSMGLGATRSETIRKVVLPAALPGIVSALVLAISRAIGETMIVVMAAGMAANLTLNPLEAVTTVTVQIGTLLTGDQEFDSPKTLAAFALGLALFAITLALNLVALRVVKTYREQYD
ncbi:phosphate ABC transporter permease subunit PstC [Phreatobacter stygius]|uniref:Phosphate transport system permease protein n=1 Tax=Phreatobacter stygius TaxID=1940610 RepID=A0A4D7ARM0_9HYPH|nr:phosphate ABC transporter permease subunit PstC [Phreatobacter stygius]QCI63609.1 phosphate ABC transporter permease subunit PstC [Phreatobacter stygius]